MNMNLHKYVGAFLEYLPMHWLAPYFPLLVRAWHTALNEGWGKVEKGVDLEANEERILDQGRLLCEDGRRPGRWLVDLRQKRKKAIGSTDK